jgi:hypothetical protein
VQHRQAVAVVEWQRGDRPVVDPCFAAALADHAVTGIAGVPHTFELAERAGADRLHVPSLRRLTVAGGRMDPDAVVRWAERADRWGAELFVMYGQTEATARMAVLPPRLARAHPCSIGRAIPGGTLTVDAPDGEIGELVYRGPNVMLGYAVDHTDLALGATVAELRTGDLARHDPRTDLFEIVGRRSRFVKPFGLRIDLDGLQADLRRELGVDAAIAGDDERIACIAPGAAPWRVARWLIDRTGLPEARVSVDTSSPVPRTCSGKVDHAAMLAAASDDDASPSDSSGGAAGVLANALGRGDVAATDTFVSLGGDSLAYVECSIRLEQRLGALPTDWHLLPVAQLDELAARRTARNRWASVDTTVVLRAIAIGLIVATHMRVWYFPGGAHLLIALCGYNLSRFLMPITGASARWRAGMRTAGRAAVPVIAWMAGGAALFGAYGAGSLLLVNNYVGPEHHDGNHWHFWFVEAFVHLVVITTALLAVPAIRRLERRRPYEFALAVLAVTLVFRYGLIEIGTGRNLRFRTHGVAWLFAIGWLLHRSDTMRRKLATTAIVLAIVPGFFYLPQRTWFIVACLVVVVWWREVRLPRIVVAPIAAVSAASLWILITHFAVWPPLTDALGRHMAYPLAIGAGVGAWATVRFTGAAIARRRCRARRPEARDHAVVVKMA